MVPDNVIKDFAHTIGIDAPSTDSSAEKMEVDAAQPPPKGFMPVRKKVAELMREGYAGAQLLTQVCCSFHVVGLAIADFRRCSSTTSLRTILGLQTSRNLNV